MEWNWFFSALAQSAAAIVGIFSAFIITKIISNQAEFARKGRRVKDAIARSQQITDEAHHRPFYWYNERVNEEAVERLKEMISAGTTLRSPEEYYRECGFSPFFPRAEALSLIADHIGEAIKGSQKASSILPGFATPILPNTQLNMHLSDRLVDLFRAERAAIFRLVEDAKYNIRKTRNLVDDVSGDPESSVLLGWSILAIIVVFYAGVIYPLGFLPVTPDAPLTLSIHGFIHVLLSLRGLILSIVSVAFTSVVIVFLVINRRLKYRPEQVKRLRSYLEMDSYSLCLGVYQNNTSWSSSGDSR